MVRFSLQDLSPLKVDCGSAEVYVDGFSAPIGRMVFKGHGCTETSCQELEFIC
jgi:hypothetical protein